MFKKLMNLSVILLTELQLAQAMNAAEDKFDFLRNQYPQLIESAEKPFEICNEENKHYQKLQLLCKEKNATPTQVLLDGIKNEMNKTTLHYFGSKYEKYVLNNIKPFISTLAENHPQHGYFKVFFERALTNHSLLEDVLLTAEYLYQVVKDQEGTNFCFWGEPHVSFKSLMRKFVKEKKMRNRGLYI